jgi:uncharacterized protein
MKWEGREQSSNVEDRRGESPGAGMGGSRMRLGGGRGIGLGTIVIALVAGWIFGINPLTVLGLLSGGGGMEAPMAQQQPDQPRSPAPAPPAGDRAAAFVATVLRDTELVWGDQFRAAGSQYQAPKLVLFRGATATACGRGESAMGPFYCPGDSKVYIDLDFFDTLSRRMGAPGDFAQAYVIAHEVGHHIQNLTGVSGKVDQMRGRLSTVQMNALSVKVELQADCYAGVFAHHANKTQRTLEAGDIEEALNAASQIGDDTLQRAGQGRVVPESFTHGSAQQRMSWFKRGFDSGRADACNTFDAR